MFSAVHHIVLRFLLPFSVVPGFCVMDCHGLNLNQIFAFTIALRNFTGLTHD